jgi:hypothetical protein
MESLSKHQPGQNLTLSFGRLTGTKQEAHKNLKNMGSKRAESKFHYI